MQLVAVRDLGAGQLEEAAGIVGRGMRDNPLHIRAFGDADERRERALARFFLPVLERCLRNGTILGAFRDGRLAGVCAMLPPGRCRITVAEKLRLLPSILRAAPRALPAILRWTGAWAQRDPAQPHWHLGPVAVDRDIQGTGIGTALLAEFCRRIDALGAAAYLETDKAKNVLFYERYDFETRAQTSVIGVPNWFMIRGKRTGRPTAPRFAEHR